PLPRRLRGAEPAELFVEPPVGAGVAVVVVAGVVLVPVVGVLVAEPGRALSAADTSAVLGVPVVATVPVRPSIARLIDAGLLAGRPDEIPGLGLLSHTLIHGVELGPGLRAHVAGGD